MNSEQRKKFGQRVKQIRKDNGLTQEDLGAMFENKSLLENPANKSVVSSWERGISVPAPYRLKIISSLGNISVNELLYGSPFEFAYNKLKEEYEENASFREVVDSTLDVRDELKDRKDFFRDQFFIKIAEEIARDDIYSLHNNYVRNSAMVYLLEKKDKGLDELNSRIKELETSRQTGEEQILYLEKFVSILRELDKAGDNIESENFDKETFIQLIKELSKITNKLIELGIDEI